MGISAQQSASAQGGEGFSPRAHSKVYHDHMASSKSLGARKRNIMNVMNRFESLKSRKGIFIAVKETVWFLFH